MEGNNSNDSVNLAANLGEGAVASQSTGEGPNELQDNLIEAVSCFRKATYEFARRNDPADHAVMLEMQRLIFVIFERALLCQPTGQDSDKYGINPDSPQAT